MQVLMLLVRTELQPMVALACATDFDAPAVPLLVEAAGACRVDLLQAVDPLVVPAWQTESWPRLV